MAMLGTTKRILALGTLLLGACSSSKEDAPSTTMSRAEQALHERFSGQLVAITPLDPAQPSCQSADPLTMDRDLFIACARLDPAKTPRELSVTSDPLAFDPKSPASYLVIHARGEGDVERWHVVMGLGDVPQGAGASKPTRGGGLLNGTNVQPRAVALLFEGLALLAASIPLFGGAAAMSNQRADAALDREDAEPLIKRIGDQLLRRAEDEDDEPCDRLDPRICEGTTISAEYIGCAGRLLGAVCGPSGETCNLEYGKEFGRKDGQCRAPCTCSRGRVIP